jgi:hypothetical protein
MSGLREIINDVTDIARRIKEIDASYKIFYNVMKGTFELHGGREGGFILTLPFDCLDARTEEYVRRTRIERLRQEMEEMDRYNKELEDRALHQAKKAAEDNLRESADKVYYERNHRKD